MGTMSFLLPRDAPASAGTDLDRACVAGGYDNMPAPTQVTRTDGELRLVRDVDESGYADQMFTARHQRQPRLDTLLGVRLNGPVPPAVSDALAESVNGVSLPMTWKAVEPTESQYKWDVVDAQLAWAADRNLRLTAGP